MNEIRLRPVTVPLSREDALAERRDAWKHLSNQLAEIQKEMLELVNTPLPTECTRYVEVRPGEPGYDEASHGIHMEDYGGRWQFAAEDLEKPPSP